MAGCTDPALSTAIDGPPDTLELIYWRHHYEPERLGMEALIAQFEAANPDTRITLRTFPQGVFGTKLATSLMTPEGPDLVNIHHSWVYTFAKKGLVTPLPESLVGGAAHGLPADPDGTEAEAEAGTNPAPAGDQRRDPFFPILDNFRHDGELFAMPIGAGNLALFYNRTLFREAGLDPDTPPQTWDQLVAMAQRLTKHDEHGRLIQAGASLGRSESQGWNFFVDGLLVQAGVPLLNEDQTAVAWNEPAGVAALTWYTDFVRRHRTNAITFPNDLDAFRLGLSAMMINGNWQLSALRRHGKDLDFGVAPLPVSPLGIRATYGNSWGTAISTRTTPEQRERAARFLAFISTYEAMKSWTRATAELPVRREVLDDEAFLAELGPLQPFLAQMPYTRASLKKDETPYRRAIIDCIDEVTYEDADPAEALERAAVKINAALEML